MEEGKKRVEKAVNVKKEKYFIFSYRIIDSMKYSDNFIKKKLNEI